MTISDASDASKKITFNLFNQNTLPNTVYEFPETNTLNSGGANSVLVAENATQDLKDKTLYNPKFKTAGAVGDVQIDASNITESRTIKFPDASATLLSTENTTLDDVNFGAGIGANNLTGQTRLQQFFYAGF